MTKLFDRIPVTLRDAGCFFFEDFKNKQSVIENGGVVTSNPTIDNGFTGDGVDDLITYNSVGLGGNGNHTMYVEITPNLMGSYQQFFQYSSDHNSVYGSWGLGYSSTGRLYVYGFNALRYTDENFLENGKTYWIAIHLTAGSSVFELFVSGFKESFTVSAGGGGVATLGMVVGANLSGLNPSSSTIHRIALFDGHLDTLSCWQLANSNKNVEFSLRSGREIVEDSQGRKYVAGEELLINGGFENGTTNWFAYLSTITSESGTRTGGSGNKIIKVTNTGAKIGSAYYPSILPVNEKVLVSGWGKGDGVDGVVGVGEGGFSDDSIWSGTNSTEWQQFNVPYIRTTGNSNLLLACNYTGVATAYFDDVSIKKIFDYSDKTWFDWRDDLKICLPMGLEQHNTNYTEDVSGNNNHFLLGDGSGTETPTKNKSKKGYTLTSTDYLQGLNKVTLNDSNNYTIFCLYNNFDSATNVLCDFRSSSPLGFGCYETDDETYSFVNSAGTVLTQEGVDKIDGLKSVAVLFEKINTTQVKNSIYVNANLLGSNNLLTFGEVEVTPYIGMNVFDTFHTSCVFYGLAFFEKKLSKLEIVDVQNWFKNGINDE